MTQSSCGVVSLAGSGLASKNRDILAINSESPIKPKWDHVLYNALCKVRAREVVISGRPQKRGSSPTVCTGGMCRGLPIDLLYFEGEWRREGGCSENSLSYQGLRFKSRGLDRERYGPLLPTILQAQATLGTPALGQLQAERKLRWVASSCCEGCRSRA